MQYITRIPSIEETLQGARKLCILGSTGSIGQSTLSVVEQQPEMFSVVALAAGRNIQVLAEQALKFRPQYLAVLHEGDIAALKQALGTNYQPEIVWGQEGYRYLAALQQVDIVVSAQVGAAGLIATYTAACHGKYIALANKESLVLAGELIQKAAQASGACILPVDSEHNALFQCLLGHPHSQLERLILTASGGPFRNCPPSELFYKKPEEALAHPTWKMGAKISIDSATLMNKGLELIEACHLFQLEMDKLSVLVHPESIVHSLVEFSDGSLLAQLGEPDMRIAIAYALAFPYRAKTGAKKLSLEQSAGLHFYPADDKNFACLALAQYAFKQKKGLSIVLNAANEVAVELFLQNKICFGQISMLIEQCLYLAEQKKDICEAQDIETVLKIDEEARKCSYAIAKNLITEKEELKKA